MAASLTPNTLLDEWQWRRERLARGPWIGSQFAAEQVRVLDYLIRRYSNSTEGQRPALSPPRPDIQVNDRAIVVLHHVGKNKVVGIKSAREAESRAARILQRMASSALADVANEAVAGDFAGDAESEITMSPYLWSEVPMWEWRFALCEWRELTASERRDATGSELNRFLSTPDPPGVVIDRMRLLLSDPSAQVRLATVQILGTIGELEDVGLLSDLLALPPAADEAPDERAAQIRAMESLAHVPT